MRVDTFGLELYGCDASLDDADALERALYSAVDAVGASVVGSTRATYQPHGVTVCLILAESHIVLATWPEHGYANLNLMLCNPDMDPQVAADAVIAALRPAQTHAWRVPQIVGPGR